MLNLLTTFINYSSEMRKRRLREAKWIIQDQKDCRRWSFDSKSQYDFKKESTKCSKWQMSGRLRTSFGWVVCEGVHLSLKGCRGLRNMQHSRKALRMEQRVELRSQDTLSCKWVRPLGVEMFCTPLTMWTKAVRNTGNKNIYRHCQFKINLQWR